MFCFCTCLMPNRSSEEKNCSRDWEEIQHPDKSFAITARCSHRIKRDLEWTRHRLLLTVEDCAWENMNCVILTVDKQKMKTHSRPDNDCPRDYLWNPKLWRIALEIPRIGNTQVFHHKEYLDNVFNREVKMVTTIWSHLHPAHIKNFYLCPVRRTI